MATSLLESLSTYLTPDLIDSIGSTLGESPGSVSKGMGAVLPALLGGVADKAKDPSALQQLFALITDDANDGSVLRDSGGLLGTLTQNKGSLATLAASLLPFLFGGRTDSISSAIANYAGIKSSSASSLIRLGAPLVLAQLGDRVRKEGLGASALASLLGGQRDSITRATPGALAGLLGHAAPRAAEPRYESRPAARAVEPERRSGLRWLLPLAIGLALLAGLWSLLRGGDDHRNRVVERAPEPAKVTMSAPKVSAPAPAAAVQRYSLPNGVQITIPQTGFETQLVGYLTDTSLPLGETWFNFDRLLFETDSASLKSESREQLAAVAEILKAYPSVKVKIGGYTDSTGDAAHNVELSRARANSVRSELIGLGIASDRLEGEGYGQEHPVASNDTEAGRAQNRRIAMQVTAR